LEAINSQTVKISFIKDFLALTKVRLSVSVVFSSIVGYLLGADQVDIRVLLMLLLGGYFMVGASNAYNQIVEKDLDALMKRTQNRPLPSGRMSVNQAFLIAVLFTIAGLSILYFINPKTAMFGAISIFMYVSLYTPLKTKTSLSVFVGAFPGAIPFMLGWVAATGNFGIEAGTLFIVQFFWQFPHFWAIGWFLFSDYEKAGFKMLPSGKQDKKTAFQTLLYTLWTVLASLIPVLGITGKLSISPVAAGIVFIIGLWFLKSAYTLYKEMEQRAARQLILVSVVYLTLIQIVYVLDKFIRIWLS
jgi:protoheme IX farnesyltransferase